MSADLPELEFWLKQLSRKDGEALRAVADLGGRTGAKVFEFGCQYPDKPYRERSWWCTTSYAGGARLMHDGAQSPAQACDGLARRLLEHGECQGCGKLSFVHNTDGYRVDEANTERALRQGVCRWRREDARWSRDCGEVGPPDSSREKLAQAMVACEVVAAGQIGAARAGRYDDFLSEHPMPLMLLCYELEQYGEPVAGLIEQVKQGVFDATRAESEAWMVSQDGRDTFAKLYSGRQGKPPQPPSGGRKKSRRRK